MKTSNIFKYVAIFFIATFFNSCVEDGDFAIPTTGEDKSYTSLKTLSEIAELYKGDIVDFDEDITTYGYVISNDRAGNFFKSIIIQDKPENPTIGFEVRIDDVNLNARYNVGRKIYINLKGLALSKYFTTFQIGVRSGNRVNRIEANDYVKYIDRSSEIATLVPTVLKTNELTDNHINTLVKIENLQPEIQGLTYADPDNTSAVNRYFTSCDTFKTIIMRTSGFANFKTLPIPDKKGNITAILNKFRNDYQLFIRDTNDVDLTQEYGCFNNPTASTLAEIKALFTGGDTTITQNSKIKVVVTSDVSKGNISNRNAFAQEGNTGIALRFSEAYDVALGDELEISVGGLKLSKFRGLLQLNLSPSNVIGKSSGTLPEPKVVTIEQALEEENQGLLVKIEGVQFKDITKTYSGANVLTSNCTDELTLFVGGSASFKDEQVNTKKGTITGVMSAYNSPQLYIRDTADINFTEDYACGSTGGGNATAEDLYISEYVEGSSSNKYIEIYNGTGTDVDLSNYSVELYGNGNTDNPRTLDFSTLTNKTLANGDVFVIYNGRANDAIKAEGDVESNVTWFNGDDALVLKKSGAIIDVVGKVGERQNWSVAGVDGATKDHTLVRKASVTKGNTDWSASAGTDATSSEWEVKDKDDFASLGKR